MASHSVVLLDSMLLAEESRHFLCVAAIVTSFVASSVPAASSGICVLHPFVSHPFVLDSQTLSEGSSCIPC
jgi:hypothetical protein